MDKAGIKHDPRNARKHNPRNLAQIESSIQRDGFGRSILLANDGTVIAGNATIDAASSAGFDDVIVVESDGTKVIAVKRTDVAPGSAEFHNLALADNRASELASWDADVLEVLNEEMDLSPFFREDELAGILDSVGAPPTLDELAAQYGESDDAAFWPEIRIKVPPDTFDRFQSIMALIDAPTDAAKVGKMLEAVNVAAVQ